MKDGAPKVITLPGEVFNCGTDKRTTPYFERVKIATLTTQMETLGYSISLLKARADVLKQKENTNYEGAQKLTSEIRNAVTLFSLQWIYAHTKKDRVTELATARLINGLLAAVRGMDAQHNLFDKSHLATFHQEIQKDVVREQFLRKKFSSYRYDPENLAQAMERAAQQRTHEIAWPWEIRPTFPNQHYGRILLDVVEIPGVPFNVYVTQPTFSDGEATLFHTHGQNWALSCPLGKTGTNRHLNTLWEPNSRDELFPLKQLPPEKRGKTNYVAGEVAVTQPKTIHGIAGARLEQRGMTLEDIAKLSPVQRQELIESTRIGESSCLHIYRGDTSLAEEFIRNPVAFTSQEPEKDFFERNDMIVFNHKTQEVWAGGGGAWEQRLLQYGRTGNECGLCFAEDYPRQKNLSSEVVYDRFIDPTAPGLLLYSSTKVSQNERR